MRFQTPQFIEIEDKIFGPFTLKQFIYLAGSAGLSFLLWRLLPGFVALFLIIPVLALGAALAFLKVNNKPFIFTVEAAVRYVLAGKLYIWRKKTEKERERENQKKESREEDVVTVPRLSESKLKDLAWSLDIHSIHEERERTQNDVTHTPLEETFTA